MRPAPTRRYRTASRSIRMFRSFLHEQDDPARFYSDLAADTIATIELHDRVLGRTVLDVGAGPKAFAAAFGTAGAAYVGVDVDAHELGADRAGTTVMADGRRLPFADGSFDIVMSSNVMEHVQRPGVVGDQMLRVTRPGGLVLISYTAWLSPWGGHETSPWHYLGGDYAARRYERRTGHPPKNRYGSSMYAAWVGQGLRWAEHHPLGELVEAVPRYHPRWARDVVRVPGLREVATWNLLLVLRRR